MIEGNFKEFGLDEVPNEIHENEEITCEKLGIFSSS